MPVPRVLVVDDHLDTLQLFEEFLSLAGFSVTLAGNGGQAIELCSDGFDAVLTDLAMPGMDGEELIRRLRHLHRPVPIVVISGQAFVNPANLCGVSYCGLLRKPCDLPTLASTLRLLIETCLHDCDRCSHRRGTTPLAATLTTARC